MESLTRQQAAEWCRSRGIGLDDRERPRPAGPVAEFKVPEDAGRRIALVAEHGRAFRDSDEVLWWTTDWSVWPSSERPHIFDRFRASYGEKRSMAEVPAHVFLASEYEDAISFTTLSSLFLWDVFLVGARGHPMLFFSHDEWGWFAE